MDRSDPTGSVFLVAALYRFAALPQWRELRMPLAEFCCARGIRGTLLLAHEGINGTVAGSHDAIAELVAHLEAIPVLAGLEVKYSTASDMPFHRMKVRLKREIVTMGVEDLDPARDAGTYIEPQDWNALIADPETVVIDTRNDYETAIGTFRGAVDPGTASFREFPGWAAARREDLAGRKVAMFCTGGIRCEKSTSWLIGQGVPEVFHLQGGILKYLEDVPPEESTWQGECFVFDDRVTVGHGLKPGAHVLCAGCRRPLAPEDLGREGYERGVSCHHCIAERSAQDRARFRERQRQIDLAAARGAGHLAGQSPDG